VSPEPPVHPGEKKYQESEGYRERQIEGDETKILADPLGLLETHQKRNERRCDYRKEVRDEQVPVSNWLERQNVFLVRVVLFLKKNGR
jgi:hypothetical protein